MNEDFEAFLRMIRSATSRIEGGYFQLPVAEGDSVYRERVYCYELYHQIRTGWNGFPYSLGGEVDKAGHPLFRDSPQAKAKPDLLVHRPGAMDANLAVVEVKPASVDAAGIRRDVEKIAWFCHHANYFAGVFIVYGGNDTPEAMARRIRDAVTGVDVARVRCLFHRALHAEAEPLTV